MALAVRIIPTLLKRGDRLVKGQRFNSWRSVGHVEQAARVYQARGVDELCILDIAATPEGRGPDFAAVERLTGQCFMPLTVGGGVRTVQDVRDLLRAGADKVAICTVTLGPELEEISHTFGAQAVTAAIDVIDGEVAVQCGSKRTLLCPVRWAESCAARGAGEILLTSIDREGTLQGYDLDLIRAVSSAVTIPVIAHGGCGLYEHMVEAVKAGASAVAAGAMFTFTEQTPRGAARYLSEHGIEARV